MDQATIELLARRAGLDKALTQFPEDVIAAANQASGSLADMKAPTDPRRTLAADEGWSQVVSDLHWLTAAAAAEAIRARKLSPVELTKALLDRIDRLDRRLKVFIRLDGDAAMDAGKAAEIEIAAGRPRGRLHGVPFGIKDIIDVAGLPTTCHSGCACRDCAAPAPSFSASSRPMNSQSAVRASICHGRRRAIRGIPSITRAARLRAPAREWRPGCFRWRSAATPAAACATPPAPAASSG
jgi:hypothetical protein